MPYNRSVPLCISLTLPCSTSLEESQFGPNRKNVACHTKMLVSNLFLFSTRNVYSSPTATSKEPRLKKPTNGSLSSNCKQNQGTSGVDHIRERLVMKGVLETANSKLDKLVTKNGKVQSQIKILPGEFGLAVVINNRLMHFDVT